MGTTLLDDALLEPSRVAAPASTLTLRKILSASAPAILNNVAAPLAAAAQLALLAQAADADVATARVAVFTAVGAAVTFCASCANFVIVVTMARVGHALGAKHWRSLGTTVRAVVVVALAVGTACALALWLGRAPLLAALSLAGTAQHDAAARYLPVAVARLPPLLLLKGCSSVLVGYQRLRLASAIQTLLALADTAAFYVALHYLGLGLVATGAAVACTCSLAALAALTCVLCLPPDPAVRVLCSCSTDGRDGGAGAASSGEQATAGALSDDPPADRASLCSLAMDSLNVLIRSLLLSGSVLALTVATAPLGVAALGAHAVVLQLWMVTSYVVDGFADVGTMYGSKLLGAGEAWRMRWLTKVLAALGLATGLGAAVLLAALEAPLSALFTRSPETSRLLATLWPLLCGLQPVNALVFVYDGLLYATRSFIFVRNTLALGVLLAFAPALAAVKICLPRSLLGVWGAKAALNGWRCAAALLRIHVQLWPGWRAQATMPLNVGSGPAV